MLERLGLVLLACVLAFAFAAVFLRAGRPLGMLPVLIMPGLCLVLRLPNIRVLKIAAGRYR
jgi:hypothetical protein